MKAEQVNAAEALNNYQSDRLTNIEQPKKPEQSENSTTKEAYEVELSEEAQEQREFTEARRETARLEEAQNSTYNASAKIGG